MLQVNQEPAVSGPRESGGCGSDLVERNPVQSARRQSPPEHRRPRFVNGALDSPLRSTYVFAIGGFWCVKAPDVRYLDATSEPPAVLTSTGTQDPAAPSWAPCAPPPSGPARWLLGSTRPTPTTCSEPCAPSSADARTSWN